MNKGIAKCPYCGTRDIDYDGNFCGHCRSDLKPFKWICEGCGKDFLGPQLNYCRFCGIAHKKAV